MSKLALTLEEATKADKLANDDCACWWNLCLLLEKLQILEDKSMITSSELYSFNFYREMVHLKTIRPDLMSQIVAALNNFGKYA